MEYYNAPGKRRHASTRREGPDAQAACMVGAFSWKPGTAWIARIGLSQGFGRLVQLRICVFGALVHRNTLDLLLNHYTE